MIKALAIKELRESWGLAVLAALGMLWVVLSGMGRNPLQVLIGNQFDTHHIAFIGDDFYGWSWAFLGMLAILLGFKQSAWEVHHNTFYFLFHRPISRRQVLAVKLAIGVLLIAIILTTAILVYGAWAAVPGNLSAPFDWSMTWDSWLLLAVLPLVYLAAFLSGIRPGRWFGTRLAPLAAMIVVLAIVVNVTFWWLRWPVMILSYVLVLISIDYFTQTRDY
jgi:ABC-type transport system involved in multi-copper enzyme maturation permease subunit